MAEMAQVEKIMTEVNALGEDEKIVLFHKIEKLINNTDNSIDNELPIDSVFGLWQDRDITLEKIRKKAWRPK